MEHTLGVYTPHAGILLILQKTCENEKSLLTDQKNALLDERDRLTTARDEFQVRKSLQIFLPRPLPPPA